MSLKANTEATEMPEKKAYLTQSVIFGMHPYRRAGEDSSVFFVDESRGIRKMLVDSEGNIQNFPGMVRENFWVEEVATGYLKPQVGFRSSFSERENGWIFKWQLQPDGWYWADEGGFGAENDVEVVLYTFVDMDGNFTGPFRLYKLGNLGYSLERFRENHVRSLEGMLKATKDGENHRDCSSDLFPELLGAKVHYIGDRFFQLRDREEAGRYWNDPVLSRDLRMLSQALLDSKKTLWSMVGRDNGRVWSCMTLFWLISKEPVFKQVLDRFFEGKMDAYTVRKMEEYRQGGSV